MSHVKKALKCISEQVILAEPDKLQNVMAGNMKKMPSGSQSLTSSMPFFFLYLILNKKKKSYKGGKSRAN